MIYRTLELHQFKPLCINGFKIVKIDGMSLINILQAPNGFGKSSIIRELTPFAATRTDYQPGGKKVLTIEHNKHVFVLTSEFTAKAGKHSFLMDNEELNLSGNSEVQNALVKQYFNYDLTIDKILRGMKQICNMQKAERKELLYATYPYQLSFVLDKYKQLVSKISACKAQLKLMTDRRLNISSQMLDDDTKKEYIKQHTDLTNKNILIDQELFLYRNLLETKTNELNSINHNCQFDKDSLNNTLISLNTRMNQLNKDNKSDICNGDVLHDILIGELSDLQHLRSSLANYQKTGSELCDEINKYRASCNNNTNDQIKECNILIETQKLLIKNNPINSSIPIITIDEANKIESVLSTITDNLMYIKSLNCLMWTESEYEQHRSDIKNLEFLISQELSFVKRGKLLTDELEKKYKNNSKVSYPKDCTRVCGIKQELDSVLNSILEDIRKNNKETDAANEKLEQHTKELNTLKSDWELRSTVRPILIRLNNSIACKSWGDYVTNNMSFIDAVNHDCIDINNRLIKLIANAKAYDINKQANDKLINLEAKLAGLKSSTEPMKEMITSVLVDKEVKLNEVNKTITDINNKIAKLEKQYNVHKEHENLIIQIKQISEDFNIYSKISLLQAEINDIKNYINACELNKAELSTKLRSLDTILKEQESLNIRMNDEILPSIKDIESKMFKYRTIANEIDPTHGLPAQSIIKYVNALLHRANQYIRNVWEYDMEFSYIDDKQTNFDFIFPVSVNNESIVPDASLASKGMKTMLNLAFTLALCSYLKLSYQYPIMLDEYTDGLQPSHVHSETEFLSNFLHSNECVQSFMVNHDVSVNSSFSDASFITLVDDDNVPSSAHVISEVTME